jgi:PiT family inorganic phosphate transporter
MLGALIFFAVCFLAYANGANDNFKGVASLFGSRTCGYRTAISWATVATFAGSVTALFLAQALIKKFSGKGLVPDDLVASPQFVLAVACGAGATVILATLLGFPISTTHGLTGALVGARENVRDAAAGQSLVGRRHRRFGLSRLPLCSIAIRRDQGNVCLRGR